MFDIEGSFDQPAARQRQAQADHHVPGSPGPAHHRGGLPPHPLRPAGVPGLGGGSARSGRPDSLPGLDPNRLEFALAESAFVDIPQHPELVDEFAQVHIQNSLEDGRAVSLAEAREFASNPVNFGILAVAQGHARHRGGRRRLQREPFFRPMVRMLAAQEDCCEAGVFVLPDEHPTSVRPEHRGVRRRGRERHHDPRRCWPRWPWAPAPSPGTSSPRTCCRTSTAPSSPTPTAARTRAPRPPWCARPPSWCRRSWRSASARGERYRSISIQGEVKVSVALSRRSATYYQPGQDVPWPGAANVIICPNLDMGSMLYHLYSIRFPDAKKFPVMFGLRFKGVDLAMDCTPEDIRLAVKASVLRMYQLRRLAGDAQGHLLPPLPGAGHQPRLHLHQDRRLRGRPGALHPGAAALRRGAPALRGQARHRPVRLPQGRDPGLPGPQRPDRWRAWTRCPAAAACSGPWPTAPTR